MLEDEDLFEDEVSDEEIDEEPTVEVFVEDIEIRSEVQPEPKGVGRERWFEERDGIMYRRKR